MLTLDDARHFANDWIAAWNAHDLTRVLDHYTNDFTMTTPFIVQLMNEPTGTLQGKEAVGAYWAIALERFPDLHFELLDVLSSVDSLCIYYRSVGGRLAAEVFWLNEAGKAHNVVAHYRP